MPSDVRVTSAVDRAASRRFKINLVIFLSVNSAILVTWVVLAFADVRVHGMWVWPVVALLWAARVAFEGRTAYRAKAGAAKTYNEDRIQREMKRIS